MLTAMPSDQEVLARLNADFALKAAKLYKIRSKAGMLEPLILNKAQQYVRARLDDQLATTGYVRALILKGRQQGVSTFVAARFYDKVTGRKGVSAYILSHQALTTDKLFNITHTYHQNMPEVLRPATSAASNNELTFSALSSSYYVGTAGSKETGRGGTIQYFHGSEVAFWPNAETHWAGIMQAVPSGKFAAGTEVILESTANGPGNMFHKMWQDAEAGKGEYIAVFVPWYWQDEYRTVPPAGWVCPPDLAGYARQFKLDDEQVRWMELKRIELIDEWKFKQEYPATAEEAFQVSGNDGFIKAPDVLEAMVPKPELEAYGPRIGALDPAAGGDRSSFALRQGRKFLKVWSKYTDDTMVLVGMAVNFIIEENLDKLFIDVDGLGIGVYDRLKELGWGHLVEPVRGNGAVMDITRYKNKRVEMWDSLRRWILEQPCELPAMQSLQADLCAPRLKNHSSGLLLLESKDEMKSRGVRSPDEGDACALTFAMPVAPRGKTGSVGSQPPEADTEWNVLE